MNNTEINPSQWAAAKKAIPANTPVVMLNLVKYNPMAVYAEGDNQKDISGREAYLTRYAPAFTQVAEKLGVTGIKVLFVGQLQAAIIAPDGEDWDDMVLVEYPDFKALQIIIESKAYAQEALPHHKAAVAGWQWFAVKKAEV